MLHIPISLYSVADLIYLVGEKFWFISKKIDIISEHKCFGLINRKKLSKFIGLLKHD